MTFDELLIVFSTKVNLSYEQVDRVAMGSPLGSTLANAFLCYYEKELLDNCPIHFKPVIKVH